MELRDLFLEVGVYLLGTGGILYSLFRVYIRYVEDNAKKAEIKTGERELELKIRAEQADLDRGLREKFQQQLDRQSVTMEQMTQTILQFAEERGQKTAIIAGLQEDIKEFEQREVAYKDTLLRMEQANIQLRRTLERECEEKADKIQKENEAIIISLRDKIGQLEMLMSGGD